MSNHLISATYKRDLRTPMRKSVMALLADKASDDGAGIYASKKTMADELCCSKQAIIDTIKGFVAEGLLSIIGERAAPNGHTVEYGINVDALEALPLVKCHAEREARKASQTGQRAGPVNEPDRSSPPTPPVNQVDPNPPEPASTKATPSTKQGASVFVLPNDIPKDPWDNFVAMRRAIRKPMTDHAKHLAVLELRKMRDEDGWPPGDVLNNSTLNSYQGLFPPKDKTNGRSATNGMAGNRQSSGGTGDGLTNAIRAARANREAVPWDADDPGRMPRLAGMG